MPDKKYAYDKRRGKWFEKSREKVFDYAALKNEKSAALLISLFRWFPDFFFDVFQSDYAKYKLELPQRMMLRIFARYGTVYITGCRGLTKTYCVMLSKEHDGIFFPGEVIRYCAPQAKQSVVLASTAFKESLRNFPIIGQMWHVNNDRQDYFKIATEYGSQFTMYAPRGDNSSSIVGEEMGQEGSDKGFDMKTFETEIHPTCRLGRKINGVDDRCHINLKEAYIANACSRTNKAYSTYRNNALRSMIHGEKYEGYAIDIPWQCALLSNIRSVEYYKKEKRALSTETWMREMEVRYIGAEENPMIPDDVLTQSRRLRVMEDQHCGDDDCIYIVSHDVSYKDSRKNAKCADVVVKLTRYETVHKREKYRKQVVFVDNYAPPSTDYGQAEKLKKLWYSFCKNGARTTYLVVDAQAYGTSVVEELMKPSADGMPTLCCIDHEFAEIEQKGSLPVIYPLKAENRGTKNNEGDMIRYAQNAFEKGEVELLIGNAYEGVDAYKQLHGIKDIYYDGRIRMPYLQTDLLCQQINNLKTEVSGMTLKERRASKAVQRDIWSALKYALRYCEILERELVRDTYKSSNEWTQLAEGTYKKSMHEKSSGAVTQRARLLQLRGGK